MRLEVEARASERVRFVVERRRAGHPPRSARAGLRPLPPHRRRPRPRLGRNRAGAGDRARDRRGTRGLGEGRRRQRRGGVHRARAAPLRRPRRGREPVDNSRGPTAGRGAAYIETVALAQPDPRGPSAKPPACIDQRAARRGSVVFHMREGHLSAVFETRSKIDCCDARPSQAGAESFDGRIE